MTYYVGIDGGGTKTTYACYDAQGICLATWVGDTCHPLQVDDHTIAERLSTGLQTVCQQIPITAEKRVVFGLAGYGNDAHLRQRLEGVCDKVLQHVPYHLMSDAELALQAAFGHEDGILVIAGTGSVAFCQRAGRLDRCGGWGQWLDDRGSSYWVASQLLHVFAKQADGRMQRTQLYDSLMAHCQLQQPYDMISYVSHTLGAKRTQIAQLARVASALAQAGEPCCRQILAEAGQHLADLVNVFAAPDHPLRVVTHGGLLTDGYDVREQFAKHLSPYIELVTAQVSATAGAYRFWQERGHER